MKNFFLGITLFFSYFCFYGQTLPEPPNFVVEKQILADDGAYWDYFGKSAAISEDGKTVVFGATRDDDNGLDSGSVYIFEQNPAGEWIQTQKLIALENTSEDEFGFSLAISNTTIIVGAYLADTNNREGSGSAYIFEKQANGIWAQTQKLVASDSGRDDQFGFAVEIKDDWAFVGAYRENILRGATYAFKRNISGVWEETQKINRSTYNIGDYFGSSMSIDNNVLVIGAHGDDDSFQASGAVYIYELQNGNSWVEIQKIKASDPAGSEFFGRSVHIYNDVIVAGAYTRDAAFVFEKNGNSWLQTAELINPDPSTCSSFGWSVTNTANKIIVGAHGGGPNNGPGGVFQYEKNTSNSWTNTQRLFTGNEDNNETFGFVVTMSNETIVVSDSQNDFISDVAGAAYIFSTDSDGDGISDTIENLDSTNSNDICDFNSERLNVTTSAWQDLDCDNDGLLNSEEIANSTNPNLADSDGDGVNDQTDSAPLDPCLPEQSTDYTGYDSTNPIWSEADCDSDGFNNGEEVTNSTNPYEDESNGHIVNPNSIDLNSLQQRRFQTSKTTQVNAENVVLRDGIAAVISKNKNGPCSYNTLHIFKQQTNGTWLDIQSIVPPSNPCQFGYALALENNVLMMSSISEDFPNNERKGVVYVYEPDNNGVWFEKQKIVPTDGIHLDTFGSEISMSGNRAAIRSRKAGGTVYLYERQNDGEWLERQQIVADSQESNEWDKISLSGTSLAIGSSRASYNNVDGGFVSLYEKNGNSWVKTDVITASTPQFNAAFGQEIILSNDLLIVGSPEYRYQEVESGAIFVFEKVNNNWVEKQMLLNSDRLEYDYFGQTIGMSGDRLVVGLHSNVSANGQHVTTNQGIYIFENDNGIWSETRKITTESYPYIGKPAVIDNDIIASSGGEYLYIYDLNIAIDTDGDGVADSTEAVDGTDPNNRCSYLSESRDLSLSSTDWDMVDCDGDGFTNGREIQLGTDPLDGCSYNIQYFVESRVLPVWESLDCDLDTVSNGEELTNGTDPLKADTDGDGVQDSNDDSPLDPCLPEQSQAYIGFDANNTIWSNADCDSDGVINGDEVMNDTDPYSNPALEVTPLNANVDYTYDSCESNSNTTINVQASGGEMPYTYSLMNPNDGSIIIPHQPNPIFENIVVGEYIVSVLDNNYQNIETFVTIANFTPITITSLKGKGECLADPQDGFLKSGTIVVTPSGGIPPYQSSLRTINGVSINPSESNPFFYEGLGEGYHILTVTDNTGCSTTHFIQITDSSCPTAELVFTTSIEVNEGSQSLTVPFQLSGEITGGFTVDYTINAITAENTTDFDGTNGTLTFAGTDDEIQNITVPIIDDIVIEANESFNIVLSNQSSLDVLLLEDTVVATISDNDLIPGSSGISFETSNILIDEDAEFAMLNITLVGNVQESFTVDYSTLDNDAQSAEDYITTSGTLTFIGVDGESQQISIPIINDNIAEIQESFSISLSNLSTSLIPIIENIATVSINDNTIATPLSITNWELSEITCRGANDASILVNISGGTAPYNYSLQDQLGNIIEDVQGNNLFENLPSGDYYISVEDATNESVTGTLINISEPTLITAEYMIGNASCSATSDGTVEIMATGGSGSFEYSLDGITFNPGNTFDNLIAGNYDIFVRDSNGCVLLGQFSILLNDGVDYDNDGIYDSCDTDIDGDGVLNEIDECPETPLGTQVNTKGCENFTLPNDAISIQTTSETCASSDNGSILVTTVENLDYVATLSNSSSIIESKDFRSFASFQDLNAGSYEVCITLKGETDFERCFTVTIDEPEALSVSGKLDPTGKSITFKMSGGDNYHITINNETTTTLLNEITLPISDTENVIEVKTDKDCQGVFNDNITINTSELLIYPNPVTNGELFVSLPNSQDENTLIALYTSNGSLIMQNVLKSNETTLRLNVQGLTSGVYNLKIETGNKTEYRRILIK